MSIGKNLAKLTIPLILLSGCSTTIYEGKIGEEYVKFMKKFGLGRYFDYLVIKKNGQELVSQNLVEYFDWNRDGKIDEILIYKGFGNVSNLKKEKGTDRFFEIGQKEYDKYTKIKIPEAKRDETNEIIKILTN